MVQKGGPTMVHELLRPREAAPLFDGWEETIITSCLTGTMGKIYGDAPEHPRSALAALGGFCFFAGEPCRELVAFAAEQPVWGYLILVPRDREWSALIAGCCGDRASLATRYATKKEPGIFDRARLEAAAASLPPEYCLREIDEALFTRCLESPWSEDLTIHYPDWETFRRLALGVVVLKNGELAAGASSYSSYPGGIEVEIDTRADHQRRGLAYAAGAALILRCLDRGWYPSWDAQNPGSLALAQKLGYHFSHEYPVYVIAGR